MQATWPTTACFSLNRQAVSVIQTPCGNTARRTPLLCSLVQWHICPGPPRGELPSKSTDTSSQSGPDERERKEMPRSYFYKALKLPSGRLVDIRYRNKYIRKWARKEAGGEPCQICCAVFIILLLLTILYVYLSNQVTPKHSSQAPFDQKSTESTTPFTDTTQEDDESSTVEGFSATVIVVTFDPSHDSSVSDADAKEARLMSRAAEQFEARSINKTTA
ncbi:hypothetical protein MRX96_020937 [Rhipicephalus microplus]